MSCKRRDVRKEVEMCDEARKSEHDGPFMVVGTGS